MPSINTCGIPNTVAITITRVIIGSKYPAGSSVVCRIDFLPTANCSWKPLRSVELVTCTLVRALTTSTGAGTGTAGPISSVRWMDLLIAACWNAFAKRDAQLRAWRLCELSWTDRTVGIGEPPPLFGVAEVTRAEVVETIVLPHGVRLHRCESIRRRDDPSRQIRDLVALRVDVDQQRLAVVAAAEWKRLRPGGRVLQQRFEALERIVHGMAPRPSCPGVPPANLAASCSLFFK